jgi:hypothetical protein
MKAIWLIAAAISGAGLIRGYDFISDTHCHSLPGVAKTLRKVRTFAERLGDTTDGRPQTAAHRLTANRSTGV